MKLLSSWTAAYEFACRSAACRPPTSGGTGGSNPKGGGSRTSASLARGQAALSKVGIGGKQLPAEKSAPAFRTSGKKVLDSSGKQVGSWTRTGDGNVWEIAVKGGQRSTLNPVKGIRDKATSYNADRVQGGTKREALANLAKRLDDRAAEVRMSGKVESVFTGGVKGVKREQAIKAGPIKASQISVSSDGSVKLKGQPSDFKIVKGYDSRMRPRYQVEGIQISSQRRQSFKTQAAAKVAIAKQIQRVQAGELA